MGKPSVCRKVQKLMGYMVPAQCPGKGNCIVSQVIIMACSQKTGRQAGNDIFVLWIMLPGTAVEPAFSPTLLPCRIVKGWQKLQGLLPLH